jgi:hypothetical protein
LIWEKLFKSEAITVGDYIELTSAFGVKKLKKLPTKG